MCVCVCVCVCVLCVCTSGRFVPAPGGYCPARHSQLPAASGVRWAPSRRLLAAHPALHPVHVSPQRQLCCQRVLLVLQAQPQVLRLSRARAALAVRAYRHPACAALLAGPAGPAAAAAPVNVRVQVGAHQLHGQRGQEAGRAPQLAEQHNALHFRPRCGRGCAALARPLPAVLQPRLPPACCPLGSACCDAARSCICLQPGRSRPPTFAARSVLPCCAVPQLTPTPRPARASATLAGPSL